MRQRNYRYGIITAAYNAAPYLETFFRSITGQTLDFERHIRLVFVDDGSTDSTARIVKRWMRRYPDNITYLYQPNQGQAAARNRGLDETDTPWVTFIDADDFVHKNYFSIVNNLLQTDTDITLAACATIFYFERFKLKVDKHPLRYKFTRNNRIIPLAQLDTDIHLAVNSAFFRTDLIKRYHLRFDIRIQPTFEDAHFTNRYLIVSSQNSRVAYIADAHYFYRKRSLRNSTVDGAWTNKALYNEVLRYGCLDLFKQAKQTLGYIPVYIQFTVLYHLSWYFKYLTSYEMTLFPLTPIQQKRFFILIRRILQEVHPTTIEALHRLQTIPTYVIDGMYLCRLRDYQKPLYAEILYRRGAIKLRYWSLFPQTIRFQIDATRLSCDNHTPIASYRLLNTPFINGYEASIRVGSFQTLRAFADDKAVQFRFGSTVQQVVTYREIPRSFKLAIKKRIYNTLRNYLLGRQK